MGIGGTAPEWLVGVWPSAGGAQAHWLIAVRAGWNFRLAGVLLFAELGSLVIKAFGDPAVFEEILFKPADLTAEKIAGLVDEAENCIGRYIG